METKSIHRFVCAIGIICGLSFATLAQEQQFANIGDLKLQNGGVIRNCRIGYRIFGKLNNDKSNVVVIPTWAGGTTEQLQSSIGPGKLVDSSKYFVVAIDALSNGVSSSPSNSRLQPRLRFPKFTLRDTVESQHELLTKVLKIDHVVTPGPAIEFGSLLGAKILNLESDCGHLATVCEASRMDAAVAEFLATDNTDH